MFYSGITAITLANTAAAYATAFILCSIIAPLSFAQENTDAPDRQITIPDNFDHWIHIGTSNGMTYADNFKMGSEVSADSNKNDSVQGCQHKPGMFKNVYIKPQAYEHYKLTGQFPEKTMFIATVYQFEYESEMSNSGIYQTEQVWVEAAIKDSEAFEETWAYTIFEKGKTTAKAFSKESGCYDCHDKNAADDNVFVQFYPRLKQYSKVKF